MNWSWLSFIVGILVGWLLEWLIDWIFWRRKHRELENQSMQSSRDLEACRADLQACRAQLDAAQAPGGEIATRGGGAPVPLDVDAEEDEAAAGPVDQTAFSPVQAVEAQAGAGELPAPDAERPYQGDGAGPADDVPETPQLIEEDQAMRGGAGVAAAAVAAFVDATDEPAPEKQALTPIEGIGPKTQGLLYEAGIVNFDQLAATPVERLQEILEAAGSRYRVINPTTWPAQARLASEGRWDDLKLLQASIVNGVIVEDNLTKIEGVGPKIAGLLREAGLASFAQVAAAPVSRLQEVLDAAGSRYRMADPSTWPEQARLAADDKWDELQALQDHLSGGRDVDASGDE